MEKARGSNAVVVWVLSIVLALLFLSTGIPKLVGANTWVFQAASMQGFPAWIKITVGIVEVCGAIALLMPRVATLGAVSLAILMLPATATQIMSHEPGAWLPVVVCVVLLLLIWQRNPADFQRTWDSLFHAPHPVLREGVITGIIGATCLAVWFFVIDVISGHLLLTPATLGHALFSVLGPGVSQSRGIDILVYTIFHYLVFIGVGIIAALVTRAARREPSLLLGFVLLFVSTEIGFYALVALLQLVTPLGALAWYNVMAGNILAAIGMGMYFWKAHPGLREDFAHSLDPSTS
jgi:uncharacterized membrane protein YphA (DoxX/SURF4 family)